MKNKSVRLDLTKNENLMNFHFAWLHTTYTEQTHRIAPCILICIKLHHTAIHCNKLQLKVLWFFSVLFFSLFFSFFLFFLGWWNPNLITVLNELWTPSDGAAGTLTLFIELIEAECNCCSPTAAGGYNTQSKATGDWQGQGCCPVFALNID